MRSIELLQELEEIPLKGDHDNYGWSQVAGYLARTQSQQFAVEAAVGVEFVMTSLYDRLNVSDELLNAYSLAFSDVAATESLHDRYLTMVERGPESVAGFVSNLKGKLAELRMPGELQREFPDFSFTVAADPTQPVWDIMAVSSGGTEVPIQVKVGASDYAGEVVDRMELAPDVVFAVSSEIHSAILEAHPELQDQLVEVGMSGYALTAEVEEDLELLAQHSGLDLPDSVGGLLPYVTEIVLAVRLVVDIVQSERDLVGIDTDDRMRVHIMKALLLFSRFGVAVVCTTAGAATGTAFDPITGAGTFFGVVAGAFTAARISKKLRPRMIEIALWAVQLDQDGLFYYRNKQQVDDIGRSLASTAV